MTLPALGQGEADLMRRYFCAALTGLTLAASKYNASREMDEPDATPSGIANEAFLVAAAAMDLDRRAIKPATLLPKHPAPAGKG
jgi:hypothetical protein